MDDRFVSSRKIKSIDYLPEGNILKIVFDNSMTYRYSNVPENIYHEMIRSKDQNTFFDKKIYAHFTLLDQKYARSPRKK